MLSNPPVWVKVRVYIRWMDSGWFGCLHQMKSWGVLCKERQLSFSPLSVALVTLVLTCSRGEEAQRTRRVKGKARWAVRAKRKVWFCTVLESWGGNHFSRHITCSIYKQVVRAFCLTDHSCSHELILKGWILLLRTSKNYTLPGPNPSSAGISRHRKSKTFIGSELEASEISKHFTAFLAFLTFLTFVAFCDLQLSCFSCWDFDESTVQALRYGRILWCFSADGYQYLIVDHIYRVGEAFGSPMVSVNWGIFDRIRTFMNTKAGSSFWSIFFWSNSCRHVSDDLCKGWRISSGVKTKLFFFGRLVVHGGWVQNGQGRRANAVLEKKKKNIYFPLFLFDADVSKRLDFTHFLLGYIPF